MWFFDLSHQTIHFILIFDQNSLKFISFFGYYINILFKAWYFSRSLHFKFGCYLMFIIQFILHLNDGSFEVLSLLFSWSNNPLILLHQRLDFILIFIYFSFILLHLSWYIVVLMRYLTFKLFHLFSVRDVCLFSWN